MFKSRRGGFTLLELLIVIIILGILAAVGIPVYTGTLEKARAKEALNMMSAIKEAEARYAQESATNTFLSVTATNSFTPTGSGNIDTSWSTRYWTLGTSASGANCTITATRSGGPQNGRTITLLISNTNYVGTWGGDHTASPTTL